jgi:hypothetical protein
LLTSAVSRKVNPSGDRCERSGSVLTVSMGGASLFDERGLFIYRPIGALSRWATPL